MALSDMQVFEEYALESATETLRQQLEVFNAASAGAITLASAGNEGDYATETFWKEIPGLMRRRDAYGAGAVAAVAIQQDAMTSVKVAGGTPPVLFEPQQLTWVQKNPEEAGVVIGEQFGVGLLADYVNSAILVGVAAIGNNAAVVQDETAATVTREGFVSASGLFGDRMGEVAIWAMHSKVITDLYKENLANTQRLFAIDGVAIMEDGFGRRMIMTDSPSMVTAGAPDTYHTLGLTSGAISVEDNGDLMTNVDTTNGQENIQRSIQAEYTFNTKVKGYSWDKAGGGASPTDAALGTGANWTKVATDDKNTAGVLLNTQ